MSEDKKYTLTEYVFRDLRFGNTYPDFATKCEKYELMNKLVRIKDPVESVKAYSKTIKGNRSLYPFDVERWELALKTYMLYPCFKESNNYTMNNKDCTINYNCNQTTIRISADALTGTREIIECAEQLYKKAAQQRKYSILKSALNDFCSVAYTVGNCCPTMKNPKTTADTCWWKLYRFHNVVEEHTVPSICDAGWNENLGSRGAQNMFGVFPERLSGREIVDRLMLKDYYDDDYNLIITATPAEYAAKGVDEYIKFIRLVTTLIIKRGIRIYNALPDDMKKSE